MKKNYLRFKDKISLRK